MLIDIHKMPPTFGIPIDRHLVIYSGNQIEPDFSSPYAYWPSVPLYHNKLHVGCHIRHKPDHLYKAFHVSSENDYIFETVFSVEPDGSHKNNCICLYTKIISRTNCTIGISLRAIDHYQDKKVTIYPVTNLIAPPSRDLNQSHRQALLFTPTGNDNIVPPVFNEQHLSRYISHITEFSSKGLGPDQLGMIYKPIYDHEPQLFEALIRGRFTKSPFHELTSYHPSVSLDRDKWFIYEETSYTSSARGLEVMVNHPAFDLLALEMISLFPGKISLQCLMTHAIDGLKDVWLTKNYYNPYHYLFKSEGFSLTDEEFFHRERLEAIFYQCAITYCQIANVDSRIFTEPHHQNFVEDSSITINKNLYDEISFTFHDIKSDSYVSFYSSFPALMLSTMSVGWY